MKAYVLIWGGLTDIIQMFLQHFPLTQMQRNGDYDIHITEETGSRQLRRHKPPHHFARGFPSSIFQLMEKCGGNHSLYGKRNKMWHVPEVSSSRTCISPDCPYEDDSLSGAYPYCTSCRYPLYHLARQHHTRHIDTGRRYGQKKQILSLFFIVLYYHIQKA